MIGFSATMVLIQCLQTKLRDTTIYDLEVFKIVGNIFENLEIEHCFELLSSSGTWTQIISTYKRLWIYETNIFRKIETQNFRRSATNLNLSLIVILKIENARRESVSLLIVKFFLNNNVVVLNVAFTEGWRIANYHGCLKTEFSWIWENDFKEFLI